MDDSRYSRQIVYANIGAEGQQKLLNSTVAIIGLGALGTVSANNLARAGVGRIKLIDRDYVSLSNLQRQTLYNEDDVDREMPKAAAAYEHLKKVNSMIQLEPVITDVNSSNIEGMIKDCDLVLDATDNFEIRLLINEACQEYKIPWIYCAAVGSIGMTMNIIPDQTPCFQCMTGESTSFENHETCSTVGVLNMITNIMASVQSAEAVKILTGSDRIRDTLLYFDIWENSVEFLKVERNESCSVCGEHHYAYFNQAGGTYTTSLCGRNEIQVIPMKKSDINFDSLAKSLDKLGKVSYNNFMLTFHDETIGFKLFKDGRAMIENAKDSNHAKSIYSEYIGL